MGLYSPPPPEHTADEDKPTLLVCWWITLFCTTIIALRVIGRFIRTERLFQEDRIAALALIPLYLRMGCVHYILLYGTNNADFADRLTLKELRRKSAASGVVLASRFFYAATLWVLKYAILEFFSRLTRTSWRRSHDAVLRSIRYVLVGTFIAVIISDLAECQPFNNYWQVLPDPGGQCRQGFVQLLTMGVCNILTDLLLVFFPVHMIFTSHMNTKKKTQLILLFSLSLGVVGVTLYRVPNTVWAHGNQQLRSLYASVELLFATTAANALVLGSFVRDRGVKKARFRHGSAAAESVGNSERRPTIHRHWGSDEDLVRGLGIGVERELREETVNGKSPDQPPAFTAAPIASIANDMQNWRFPPRSRSNAEHSSEDSFRDNLQSSRSNSTTHRRVSFFDVGGLLDNEPTRSVRDSYNSSIEPLAPQNASTPSPTFPASSTGFRRGSQTFLQDLSNLFHSKPSRPQTKPGSPLPPISQHPRESSLAMTPKSPKQQDSDTG